MKISDYIVKNRFLWICIALLMALCHGTMMLGNSIGIDTEDIINLQNQFYGGWLTTGRQGLVLIKRLTDNLIFNPQLAGAATLVFLTAACILWTYLFTYISKKENILSIAGFSIIIAVSTVLTEQLYFKLQAMELTLGFCIMACNLLLLYHTLELQMKKQLKQWILIIRYFIVIAINIVLFSIYQAMVPLYIFGSVTCFYLYYFSTNEDKNTDTKEEESSRNLGVFFGVILVVFILSFLLNQWITSMYFSGSDYLQSQFLWFTYPFLDCLMNIWVHIKEIMLGTQIYYVKPFVLYCILITVFSLCYLKKSIKRKTWIFGILAVIGVLLAPFYMTILCGHAPNIRAQLVLPFTLAFMVYFLFLIADGKRIMLYGLMILGIISAYLQLKYTMLLNYSDQMRYESDYRTASSMIERIDLLQNEEKSYPVVFVGKQAAKLNNSCIKGEVIGYSFFEWDVNIEPYGYYNSRRILGFMHSMGEKYAWADVDTTRMAYEYSSTMENWPSEKSVELYNDVVIIKLSD